MPNPAISTSDYDPNRENLKVRRGAAEELRDAIAAVQEHHPQISMSWAVAHALKLVRRELEVYFNNGQPFPPRAKQLRDGRRARPKDGERVFEVV